MITGCWRARGGLITEGMDLGPPIPTVADGEQMEDCGGDGDDAAEDEGDDMDDDVVAEGDDLFIGGCETLLILSRGGLALICRS